ncbi:restriction endonuclease FokI C-terminal domain-containing protein [Loigolactobacillus coryniformis]|uniref:Type II site-specific deoxyribonuclease n=1 Tax=Loigolactobacillus coryniformis subsp. coryniformis KCTC 3167 = DSM 20001 TaxID=913848 RepID=A0A0R1F147_9LACO|nr:restriction endonuclease FokI C-terminal domain-containing protein [Loigolactobacillus coryniformis]ATO55611.1 restriction endonuclease [Loigolactobacillus coryniformis subsp. coryniformis KCTC 3167 = DSM 20001]KRK15504.1 Type II site-specific deoxyribonuclease [Loigolactobacillus coryniformis subsp. coryniformis KCTC 3167 = DSM 20001]
MTITINYYPKKTKRFSIGLGQDVGSLRSMVNMLQVFVINSPIQKKLIKRLSWRMSDQTLHKKYLKILSSSPVRATVKDLSIEYKKLKHTNASPNIRGILQGIMDGQKYARDRNNNLLLDPEGKPYKLSMRSWAIRNFISLAISLGFLNWNRVNGDITLTAFGYQLATAKHFSTEELTNDETKLFTRAFISLPYAVGFMRTLKNTPNGLNKFELGEKFGFAGEEGFVSFGSKIFIDALKEAYRKNDEKLAKTINSNWESTSDKYIRSLASLLGKLNFVHTSKQKIKYKDEEQKDRSFKISIYSLTGLGRQALGYALGLSSHPRSKKNIIWDMLATKGSQQTYIRTVRALILKELSESRYLTAELLATRINNNRINSKRVLNGELVTADEIIDHITGLNGIGLEITSSHRGFILKDKISDFEIPVLATDLPHKDNVIKQQDELRPMLKHVNHKYLQLVELAFESSRNSEYSQFETLTMELVLKYLDFSGKSLGGANKPDGIAWDPLGNFLIFDTKAYKHGYTLSNNTDRVARYINDVRDKDIQRISRWWQSIPTYIDVKNKLQFVYISGSFTGHYLRLLNDLRSRTRAKGGLVTVEKLLLTTERYLAEADYTHKELFDDWMDDNIEHEEYFYSLQDALK